MTWNFNTALRCVAAVFLLTFFVGKDAFSQVSKRKKVKLFYEDADSAQKAEKATEAAIIQPEPNPSTDVDIKAPNIEFLKDSSEVKASGGVVLSGKDVHAQAESALLNSETKDAHLEGDVLFDGSNTVIDCDSAFVNLDDETGEFKDAKFEYEEGGYQVQGRDIYKLSEYRYRIFDSHFSTCHCNDGSVPWSIDSDEARVTQEGYARTWDTTLHFHGVPIFYTPYFAFPAKLERTSGLLVPEWGYSNQDGLRYKQPFFYNIDDSTDLIISPWIENRSRKGSEFDFRKEVSRHHRIESAFIYSDESARGSGLRGLKVGGLFDPTIDTNRTGGYYYETWRADKDAYLPARFVSDLRYTSDDLFLREIENDKIGYATDRYLTSQMTLRTPLGDYFSSELTGEFNQDLIENDDLMLQRLPEASLTGLKSFRPFGFNPYGIKLVTRENYTVTEFERKEGYDGLRTDLNPSITLPFHYQNYISASLGGGVRRTTYDLNERVIPQSGGALLEPSRDRNIPFLNSGLTTAVEKVYDLPEDNSLTYLTSLGSSNQVLKLARVKHVVEPFMKYSFIPDISQGDYPRFDSIDRISEKSLMLYGFNTSLLGRFVPRKSDEVTISELTPQMTELPTLQDETALEDFGGEDPASSILGNVAMRQGEIRDLVDLSIMQGFNYRVAEHPENYPSANPYTDVKTGLAVNPSPIFGLRVDNNYDTYKHRFSSWSTTAKLLDDRDDYIWTRLSYIDSSVNQIDGGVELTLSERLKLGWYTRFDDGEGSQAFSQFLNNRVALRILSACKCWHMDLGFSDKANPEKQQVSLTFSFGGLGDLNQDFATWTPKQDN